jgi:hypothetical protein
MSVLNTELTPQPGAEDGACEPSQQLGANGDVEDQVRDAVREVTSRPTRDQLTGRYIRGAIGGAGKTLAGSELLRAALEPLKHEIASRVLTDRGADDGAAETLVGLTGAYAESRLLREAMWARMLELGGPVTNKGKKRALFDAYLSALDREVKLATLLGLERRQRQLNIAEAFARLQQEKR